MFPSSEKVRAMDLASLEKPAIRAPAHPNDVDRKRIERALKARKRYRYVSPIVAAVAGAYRIESPCCSRNIDTNGGVIDVALLLYDADRKAWQLFRKDHRRENGSFTALMPACTSSWIG